MIIGNIVSQAAILSKALSFGKDPNTLFLDSAQWVIPVALSGKLRYIVVIRGRIPHASKQLLEVVHRDR